MNGDWQFESFLVLWRGYYIRLVPLKLSFCSRSRINLLNRYFQMVYFKLLLCKKWTFWEDLYNFLLAQTIKIWPDTSEKWTSFLLVDISMTCLQVLWHPLQYLPQSWLFHPRHEITKGLIAKNTSLILTFWVLNRKVLKEFCFELVRHSCIN